MEVTNTMGAGELVRKYLESTLEATCWERW